MQLSNVMVEYVKETGSVDAERCLSFGGRAVALAKSERGGAAARTHHVNIASMST